VFPAPKFSDIRYKKNYSLAGGAMMDAVLCGPHGRTFGVQPEVVSAQAKLRDPRWTGR